MGELVVVLGPLGAAAAAVAGLVAGARRAAARRRAWTELGTARDDVAPMLQLPRRWFATEPMPGAEAVPRAWCWRWVAAVSAAGALAWAALGPAGTVAAAATAAAGPRWWARARERRLARRYEQDIPEWLAALARSLRAGATPRLALGDAAEACGPPLDDDARRLHRAGRDGLGLVPSLEGWARRRPLPAVRLAAAALVIGERAGGLNARAVDDLAEVIRVRLDGRAEVWALTAQVRASAVVMVVAPLAFLGLISWSDPAVRDFLARSPAGWACLTAGLLLDTAAAWAMARMLRSFG